jgi:hypothetical protein
LGALRSGQEVAAVTGPAGVHTGARQLRVGDHWAATLAITGYPAEVGMSWLEPLLSWPGRLDVALHIDPIPTDQAAARLRTQRARLESTRRIAAAHGRLDDPLIDATAADAADLADLVARGESRLFSVGIYLTVHARTRAQLIDAVADLRAAAASVLLDTQPATWRHLAGWTSTLPLGHDGLHQRRIMDTEALAACFPLACPDLPGPLPGEDDIPDGVLFGISAGSGPPLIWDRWACDNHNSVVLAHSGAGKSYLIKLDLLRNLYDHVTAAVIDPEDEYVPLAHAVGGTVVQLGAPGVHLNPLDLPIGDTRPDALTRRALFLHTLVGVLLAHELPPAERAALDRAITATYTRAGITADPATWTRPAPLLRDLSTTLSADTTSTDGAAATLAARLSPWSTGSFRDLFDGPTTTHPTGHLVVWSTRHLPDELRAAGMLLALDAIWRDIDIPPAPVWDPHLAQRARHLSDRLTDGRPTGHQRRENRDQDGGPATQSRTPPARRLVIVDEAWALMSTPEGARFLARMAKSARKRRAGLSVITQDAADLLGSDLGQIVVNNAATQILMRQAPQAIAAVTTAFDLTAGEARMLLSAQRGQALLLCGGTRIPFLAIASDAEHRLASGRSGPPGDLKEQAALDEQGPREPSRDLDDLDDLDDLNDGDGPYGGQPWT